MRRKALQDSLDLAAIIKFATSLEELEAQSKFVEDAVHFDGASSSIKIKQEALSVQGRSQNRPNRASVNNSSHYGSQYKPRRDAGGHISSQRPQYQSYFKPGGNSSAKHQASGDICTKCGQVRRVKCPAEGKTWSNCKKVGHFAKVCRSKATFQ